MLEFKNNRKKNIKLSIIKCNRLLQAILKKIIAFYSQKLDVFIVFNILTLIKSFFLLGCKPVKTFKIFLIVFP